MRQGHVGYWPQYREKPRERTIAIYDGSRFVSEHGEVLTCSTWNDFKNVTIDERLDVYVHSLIQFPYFSEAVADEASTVIASHRRNIMGIRFRKGRYSGYVSQPTAWNLKFFTDPTFMASLRRCYDYCHSGAPSTPGALGQYLWKESYYQSGGKPVSRPCVACRSDILNNLIGGRVDTPGIGQSYSKVYELDIRSAYVSMCDTLPDGTAVRIMRGDCEGYVTFFTQCEVEINHHLPLGVFPMRANEKVTTYPTAPGIYSVWLWKEEVDACIAAGLRVTPFRGWGWRSWNTHSWEWARRMDDLRSNAPDETTADIIKHAIVAAVGRHGMQPYKYTVIHEKDSKEGDEPIVDKYGTIPITSFFLRKTDEMDNANLTHWFAHIIARCRVKLYARAREEQLAGNVLVATNYDAVYLKYPSRLSTDGIMLGSWKHSELTNVTIPYPRAVISDEKVRLPGTPHEHVRHHTLSTPRV